VGSQVAGESCLPDNWYYGAGNIVLRTLSHDGLRSDWGGYLSYSPMRWGAGTLFYNIFVVYDCSLLEQDPQAI
jgi:hypothetical protein